MEIPPRHIVISGGGIRAVSHIGALQVLEEMGLLKSVKEYIGVSAGAFLGFCLCIGYTLREINHIINSFDFQLIRNISPESMIEFPTQYGIDDGENLVKFIRSIMKQRGFDPETTFTTLNTNTNTNTGTKAKLAFRCYATDIFTCMPREFSIEKTPNIKVITALRASMSLPAYFIPVEDPETGHLLIDGGIMDNYPMSFLTEEEREQSLGLSFSYTHTSVKDIPDITAFFLQVYACYYIPRARMTEDIYYDRTILIPNGEYPAWNFEATEEDRRNLFETGRTAAASFFKNYRKEITKKRGKRGKIGRRFSVG